MQKEHKICMIGKGKLQMGKKIIVLNGSSRKSGNTSALVHEFVRGAEQAGNTVTVFDLGSMQINGCKGCFGGGKIRTVPAYKKMTWKKFIRLTKKPTFWC